MPDCSRLHIKDIPFHKHSGCCKFFCLSQCSRGETCNFHHDEACRYLTWTLLRNHKVDPARVGSQDTMDIALSYVPDDDSVAQSIHSTITDNNPPQSQVGATPRRRRQDQ